MAFTPSPAIHRNVHQGNPVDVPKQTDNGWIKAHASIAPYLVLVSIASKNAGLDPYFQGAVLAQENGGFDRWSTNAHSSANANGIAQFIPSTWAGSWNPYRNKSPNDPNYAIPAQAIFLKRLLHDNGGSMDRAAGAYYGAMDPRYVGGVRAYYNELKQNNVFDAISGVVTKTNGGIDGAISGVVDTVAGAATDAAKAGATFVDYITHPSKLGNLVAEVFAIFLKFVWKAVWNYVLAPPFHWCQRATIYYYENIMGSKEGENSGYYYDYAAAATVAFWSVGYALLYRNADNLGSKSISRDDTPLGRVVNSVGGVVAKKNVIAANKVKEQTPDKPTPVISEVKIDKVKVLSATRRRQISIGTESGNDDERNRGTESGAGEAAPEGVTTQEDPASEAVAETASEAAAV